MKDRKVYVIIPAYEPDGRLLGIVNDIHEKTDYDIIVVNDGSGKKYDLIFKMASANSTVLTHERNYGKGRAIKTALAYIKATETEYAEIVTADSDGQHTVKDIMRTATALGENPDALILGSRKFTGEVPLRSRFGNGVTRFVFSVATGKKVYDTQTGLRAFTTDMLTYMMSVEGDRYEYEMNVLMRCAYDGKRIAELPIETVYIGKNESSHFNTFKDSWRIYKEIFRFSTAHSHKKKGFEVNEKYQQG